MLLKILTRRFGPLSDAVEATVRKANSAEIGPMAERVLEATSLEELLRDCIYGDM